MEAIGTGSYALVVDLNVGLLSINIKFVAHCHVSSATSSRLRPPAGEVPLTEVLVEAECNVALAHIFAVLNRLDFALVHLAKVVRVELSFSATLIVYSSATQRVLRHAIARDSLLLSESLRLAGLADTSHVALFTEEGIVCISCCAIVKAWLEAHFEVHSSHHLWISSIHIFPLLQLLRGEGCCSGCLSGKLGRAIR